MTPEEFRRHGHTVVDWIADYYARIESLPVLSRARPGEVRGSLPPEPPESGESFETILHDVEKLILPGITHWQSPNFFAFFPANASGPGILGDLVSSGLGVQGMLWATSPACTELETHVLDWLVKMLDLPEKFLSTSTGGGVIQDTASSASLCALLAARERATNFVSNQRGCDGKLVAYASAQAHSSIEKDVQIAGLGRENLRMIEVDKNFAMRVRLSRIDAPAWCPASFARRSVRLRPMRLTLCLRLDAYAVSTSSGCTWMLLCPAPPRSAQNFATFMTDLNTLTATASTRISGCSPILTAIASMSPIAKRSSRL